MTRRLTAALLLCAALSPGMPAQGGTASNNAGSSNYAGSGNPSASINTEPNATADDNTPCAPQAGDPNEGWLKNCGSNANGHNIGGQGGVASGRVPQGPQP